MFIQKCSSVHRERYFWLLFVSGQLAFALSQIMARLSISWLPVNLIDFFQGFSTGFMVVAITGYVLYKGRSSRQNDLSGL